MNLIRVLNCRKAIIIMNRMLLETGISKCFWWNIEVLEMRKMSLDFREWATWVTKVADNLTRLWSTFLCEVGPRWGRTTPSIRTMCESGPLPLSGPRVGSDQSLCQDCGRGWTTVYREDLCMKYEFSQSSQQSGREAAFQKRPVGGPCCLIV